MENRRPIHPEDRTRHPSYSDSEKEPWLAVRRVLSDKEAENKIQRDPLLGITSVMEINGALLD